VKRPVPRVANRAQLLDLYQKEFNALKIVLELRAARLRHISPTFHMVNRKEVQRMYFVASKIAELNRNPQLAKGLMEISQSRVRSGREADRIYEEAYKKYGFGKEAGRAGLFLAAGSSASDPALSVMLLGASVIGTGPALKRGIDIAKLNSQIRKMRAEIAKIENQPHP